MDHALLPSPQAVCSVILLRSRLAKGLCIYSPHLALRSHASGRQRSKASGRWLAQGRFKDSAWVCSHYRILFFAKVLAAPFEALIPASVADIWHVHERGFRMAIFNLGVLGGIVSQNPESDHLFTLINTIRRILLVLLVSFFCNYYLNCQLTVQAGSVIQQGSYRIAMHAMGGAFVLMLLLVIFFMPESAFHREDALNIDTSGKVVDVGALEKEKNIQIEDQARTSTVSEPQKSFTQELVPWSGYWDHISFWRTLLRPFVLILSPVVMWATLLFTICISWLVLISITLSQIFSAPPYNFSVSSVGATNVSSFVASVLATLVAGPIIDGVAKYMSKRNKGIFGKLTSAIRRNQPKYCYRTRVSIASHGNISNLHGYWFLRMGRKSVQSGSLARSCHCLHGSHQSRSSIGNDVCCNIR